VQVLGSDRVLSSVLFDSAIDSQGALFPREPLNERKFAVETQGAAAGPPFRFHGLGDEKPPVEDLALPKFGESGKLGVNNKVGVPVDVDKIRA